MGRTCAPAGRAYKISRSPRAGCPAIQRGEARARRPTLSICLDFADKRCGVDDLDALKMLDVPQMGVTGDDIIRPAFQSTGQELVVRGIFGQPVSLIDVFGNNSLSEYQP